MMKVESGEMKVESEATQPASATPSTLHSPLSTRLVSGLFWVLLANLIVKPLWILGIEVGVQNAVGDKVYGFYAALFSFSYIFNILLDLGVTNFNTRNIARHPQLIGKHLSGILTLKLLLLCLYLVVTFTAGAMMGYRSDEFRLLAWLCAAQFLNSLILYLRSNFEGLLLFRWDSLFSVLDRLLMIVICGFLLFGGHFSVLNYQFTIYHFVYAQVFAYAVTALLAFVVIVRKVTSHPSVSALSASATLSTLHSPLSTLHSPLSTLHSPLSTHHSPSTFHLTWNWPFCLAVLRRSAPFALLVLLMASYNRIDPILLRRLAGDADAGIYAGAFRLLDALTMVAYLVSVPLLPVFSKICKERSEFGVRRVPSSQLVSVLRIVFWPMMLFAVGCAVAGTLLAGPLMRLLYANGGAAYVPVFRVLIFGLIPIGITYIFGTLLTAGGRLRQLNIFAATSLVLNIVANLMLIPRLGAVGSAWASLTAQTFMAVAQLALAVAIYSLPLRAFLPPSPREVVAFAKSQMHSSVG